MSLLKQLVKKGLHHRLLDRCVGRIRGSFIPVPFYQHGWGDLDYPVQVRKWLQNFAEDVETPAKGFEISWQKPHNDFGLGRKFDLSEGTFATPSTWTESIPNECRTGHVLRVKPKGPLKSRSNPTVILLAGTGDHGFKRRLKRIAAPLAKVGISSLVLESPYYGKRRAHGQIGAKLKTVSDLGVLGRVTIEEALALIQYSIRNEGPGPYAGKGLLSHLYRTDYVCLVAGISMGGLHSAMVASLSPYPCGAVCWLAPTSASPVFSEGILSSCCDWDVLRRTPNEDPKEVLSKFLSFTDIEQFCVYSRPKFPEYVSIVGAQHDEFVPLHAYEKWKQITRDEWNGGTFSWIDGGHITGSVFRYKELRQKIVKVLETMENNNHLAT